MLHLFNGDRTDSEINSSCVTFANCETPHNNEPASIYFCNCVHISIHQSNTYFLRFTDVKGLYTSRTHMYDNIGDNFEYLIMNHTYGDRDAMQQ